MENNEEYKKKFLKNNLNWLLISIMVSLLIVGLVIIYREQADNQDKERCEELAEEFLDNLPDYLRQQNKQIRCTLANKFVCTCQIDYKFNLE